MQPLVLDDDALARIDELGDDPALHALAALPADQALAVRGRVIDELDYDELSPGGLGPRRASCVSASAVACARCAPSWGGTSDAAIVVDGTREPHFEMLDRQGSCRMSAPREQEASRSRYGRSRPPSRLWRRRERDLSAPVRGRSRRGMRSRPRRYASAIERGSQVRRPHQDQSMRSPGRTRPLWYASTTS
jgi:hypothetical protein